MTTTVADVAGWLERFAPSHLAESWDNVGLLWGDPSVVVERVMTCLTVTPTTAAEAIRARAGLIVSHHPVLFRAVKQVRADRVETGYLWDLARAGVAIASPHTAFDNTDGGINDLLCRRLGIVETSPLRPIGSGRASFKVVVFTPEADREAVMAGAFAAGAGVIGDYRECSFAIPGAGTFFGTEATDPAIGQKGRRETVAELRLEFVCPANRLDAASPRSESGTRMRSPRSTSTRCTMSDQRPAPVASGGSRNRRASRTSRRRSGGRWAARASSSWAIRGGPSAARRFAAGPATTSSRTPRLSGRTS